MLGVAVLKDHEGWQDSFLQKDLSNIVKYLLLKLICIMSKLIKGNGCFISRGQTDTALDSFQCSFFETGASKTYIYVLYIEA